MFQLHKIVLAVEKTQVQVTLARQQMCSGDHKMECHAKVSLD